MANLTRADAVYWVKAIITDRILKKPEITAAGAFIEEANATDLDAPSIAVLTLKTWRLISKLTGRPILPANFVFDVLRNAVGHANPEHESNNIRNHTCMGMLYAEKSKWIAGDDEISPTRKGWRILNEVRHVIPQRRMRRRGKKNQPKHWHNRARQYLQYTKGEIPDAEIARLCEIDKSVLSRDPTFQALRKSYVVKKPLKQLSEKR